VIVIIAYDITDDRRREDVAMLLSGYGPSCPALGLRVPSPLRR
jgi:hypothetical protein